MAEYAQTFAKSYNSPEWQAAADQLRMPFWDWASLPSRFPPVMKTPTIQITTPTGVQNVKNPLYRYQFLNHPEPAEWFPNDPSDSDYYLGSKPWTLRNPDQSDNQRDEVTDQILADDGPSLTSQVVRYSQ